MYKEPDPLQRLVSMAPFDKELRLRLAKQLISVGRLEEAMDQIRAVIRLDSNNLQARELRLAVRERMAGHPAGGAVDLNGQPAS